MTIGSTGCGGGMPPMTNTAAARPMPRLALEGGGARQLDAPDLEELDGISRQLTFANGGASLGIGYGTRGYAATAMAHSHGGGSTTPTDDDSLMTDSGPPSKTAVDGQWGPGGVTSFRRGGIDVAADCGMDHGVAQTGQRRRGTGMMPPPFMSLLPGEASAGPSTAVGGVRGLGVPSLQASFAELIEVLRELSATMARTSAAGAPAQSAPAKGAPTPPASTDSVDPKATPTSTPATDSGGSTSTAPTATDSKTQAAPVAATMAKDSTSADSGSTDSTKTSTESGTST